MFKFRAVLPTAFVVIGVALAAIGICVNVGLVWFGATVYYTRGLEHAALFSRAVAHYQPHLSLYTALAVVVGVVLYGCGMLSMPTETSIQPKSIRPRP